MGLISSVEGLEYGVSMYRKALEADPDYARRIVTFFKLLRRRAGVRDFVVSFDDQPTLLTDLARMQTLFLMLTGGEPITVWLNDEPVTIGERKRYLCANGARIPVVLNQGRNRMLIRMENRHRDEFLAPRLIDVSGGGARDVYVSFEAIEDCPAMPERYLGQDWDELTSRIPSIPPSPDEASFGANLSRTMALLESGGQALVTADHGNCEQMVDYDSGQNHTQHTTELVPLVYIGAAPVSLSADGGILADIAPSLLSLIGLEQPPEMTGHSLVTIAS